MEQTTLSALTQSVLERIFIELEASARHVHLTKDQAQTLFGHDLTPERPLSQPGQYLSKERLTLQGPKGKFYNVAVLGPARKEAQVEISLTDGKTLGIQPPIRQSGDVAGSPGVILVGPQGTIALQQGVIVAKRHLHLTPQSAARFGVRDKQIVKLQTFTQRPLVFEDVIVRVSPDFADRAHLDFDEANACAMLTGDLGRILL
ncbi:MAG: phosphate propanoyltransferase [Oscillospiraceae bacterium]|nr:phosphate propanoyltransferase [Oscillospiraceae bacterium]